MAVNNPLLDSVHDLLFFPFFKNIFNIPLFSLPIK